MPTDDELTTLLHRGFAQATADLDPDPDLVHVIHRRHAGARRRRVAVAVAVPAAAVAAGAGFALAGPGTVNHTPNHTAVAAGPPSAPARNGSAPRTTPRTSAPIKVASYQVDRQMVRRHHSAPLNCPADATAAPFGKSANPQPGAWFWTHGKCFFVAVGGADTKPADATPIHIKGYPGLYGTLKDGVRTIYAPGIGGRGWWVLKMPASTLLKTAVRMIVPAN
jgi:hypothetical protein